MCLSLPACTLLLPRVADTPCCRHQLRLSAQDSAALKEQLRDGQYVLRAHLTVQGGGLEIYPSQITLSDPAQQARPCQPRTSCTDTAADFLWAAGKRELQWR